MIGFQQQTAHSKRVCRSLKAGRTIAVFASARYSVPPSLAVTPVAAVSSRSTRLRQADRRSRLSPCDFSAVSGVSALSAVLNTVLRKLFYETNPFGYYSENGQRR